VLDAIGGIIWRVAPDVAVTLEPTHQGRGPRALPPPLSPPASIDLALRAGRLKDASLNELGRRKFALGRSKRFAIARQILRTATFLPST